MTVMRLLLPLLFSLPMFLQAQTFAPGELVTLEGDTMSGLIAKASGGNWAYKANGKAGRNYFKEEDLGGYVLDGDRYERHIVDVLMGRFPERRNVFCKVMVEGTVRLLEYSGKGMLGGTHGNMFLHHADAEMPYRISDNPRLFKTEMAIYFAEHEELAAQIKKKELTYENIVGIVVMYNMWAEEKALQELAEEEASETDGE